MIKTFIFIALTSIFSYLTTDILEKPNAKKPNLDTNRVFYYSFREEKVLDIKNTENKLINEKLEVCQGSKVLLEAPVFYANAIYFWEGPLGFRSYSQKVLIENVNETQGGIYTVSVKNERGLVSGQIEVKVHKKPMGNYVVSSQNDYVKYELSGLDESSQIVWKDAHLNYLGIGKTFSIKQSDTKGLQVFLKRGKCENIVKID